MPSYNQKALERLYGEELQLLELMTRKEIGVESGIDPIYDAHVRRAILYYIDRIRAGELDPRRQFFQCERCNQIEMKCEGLPFHANDEDGNLQLLCAKCSETMPAKA